MDERAVLWSESTQERLALSLTDFWAEDTWDMNESPLGPAKSLPRRGSLRVAFATVPDGVRTEVKYAFRQMFEQGTWSLRSAYEKNWELSSLGHYLTERAPHCRSLLETSLDAWETSLRSWLVAQGKWPGGAQGKWVRSDGMTVPIASIHGSVTLLRRVYRVLQDAYDERPELERDVWNLRRLVPDRLSPTTAHHTLPFTKIGPPWLRALAKRFLAYWVTVRSVNDTRTKLHALEYFSAFLQACYPEIAPLALTRAIIVEYLTWLAQRELADHTRSASLVSLRLFLETCAREGWADLPKERLIYDDDLPSSSQHLTPRPVSHDVLKQLNDHLEKLDPQTMRMLLILQECGMRVSELCGMPLDCLRQDAAGDWQVTYDQFKSHKEHSIPITRELAGAIVVQQHEVRARFGDSCPYLFPVNKGTAATTQYFRHRINLWAVECDIRDATGGVWRFRPHQFRHTVGMRMIGNNVPQHIIQRFLGHESAEMTAHYAHLHDQALREAYGASRDTTMDARGRSVAEEAPVGEIEWLRKNVLGQAQQPQEGQPRPPLPPQERRSESAKDVIIMTLRERVRRLEEENATLRE